MENYSVSCPEVRHIHSMGLSNTFTHTNKWKHMHSLGLGACCCPPGERQGKEISDYSRASPLSQSDRHWGPVAAGMSVHTLHKDNSGNRQIMAFETTMVDTVSEKDHCFFSQATTTLVVLENRFESAFFVKLNCLIRTVSPKQLFCRDGQPPRSWQIFSCYKYN